MAGRLALRGYFPSGEAFEETLGISSGYNWDGAWDGFGRDGLSSVLREGPGRCMSVGVSVTDIQ